jgi:DNA polymerase (family 10)
LKEISLIDISQHHHESKVSACTKNGTVVNIYLTKDKSEATTRLFLVTGSTAHLDGLFTGGEDREKFLDALPKPLEEKSLYHAFGLSYIPPEYRETCVSLGPAQAAFAKGQQDVPLLCSSDICGILHTHSTYSDGALGVKELAEQAIGLGYSFLGISDHSQSAAYAGGLSIDSVKRQHEEIDRLNEVLAPFRLFKGIESDILRDGSLDYPESVLESFDYVIISIHSGFSMSEEEMTRRIVRALAHPLSSILGHPTGRLLKKRKPYAVCLPKVLEAAAETKTAVEINSNPWRLDLDAEHAAEAARLGIQIPISPDAHSQEGFSHVEYGVCIARKAGLRAENILTTKTTAQLLEYFNAQRKFKSKSP